MSWIRDKLLGLRAVFFGGEQLPERGALEFVGDGVDVEDDPINKRTKVTVTGGGGVSDGVVDTAAGGDIAFQQGGATFARLRSTSEPAQAGDMRFDASSGQLYVYVTGGGVGSGAGEIALLGYKVSFPKLTPDGSAAALFTETAVMGPPGFDWTLGSAAFIPSAPLEADAVNYASLVLSLRSASGAHIVVAAVGDTTPEGDNSTGSWSSFVPVPLTIQPDFMVAAAGGSEILVFDIGKAGSGVIVPSGVLVLSIVPWQEG